jgi:pimeloyl-ACP methyl ester carboxylesterase
VTLHCEDHGSGSPTVLLLHGLGANGASWSPFVDRLRTRFSGRIVVPDLRGHGRSLHATKYGYGQHAADLAELLAADESVYVIGHSMGGLIGLALATGWFGVTVHGVLAFGTKLAFTEEQLAKLSAQGQAPVRRFKTRAEAAARFLKVSGLDGLCPPESAVVDVSITALDTGYALSADPRTVTAAGPEFAVLFAAARCPVVLACGSGDPMVTVQELRAFDPGAVEFAGLHHNAHVEAPDAVIRLLEDKLLRNKAGTGGTPRIG